MAVTNVLLLLTLEIGRKGFFLTGNNFLLPIDSSFFLLIFFNEMFSQLNLEYLGNERECASRKFKLFLRY